MNFPPTNSYFSNPYPHYTIKITALYITFATYNAVISSGPDGKSFPHLADKVSEFVTTYDSNEEYKQYVQSGTGSRENVKGRFDYWRGIVKTLQ